jgi:hypothetical protein
MVISSRVGQGVLHKEGEHGGISNNPPSPLPGWTSRPLCILVSMALRCGVCLKPSVYPFCMVTFWLG